MPVHAALTVAPVVRSLRTRYRQEMNCQIVKESIHTRAGWSMTYALGVDETLAGFGTVAIGGPWKGKPTILEFYVLPEHRAAAFDLFEALLGASGARLMEIQSNDLLLAAMLHTFARDITSEAIVFRDGVTTAHQVNGAVLQPLTPDEEVRASIDERQGGPEYLLQVDGTPTGKGGILFHYNRPYGDVYMEIDEAFRGRGFGGYLVQELKRQAYELGSIPAARCSPNNSASRKTLQRAGFVPYAHILTGTISGP